MRRLHFKSIHFGFWLIISLIASAQLAQAQITLTGNYSPSYNGSDDPWNVGADLLLAVNGDGAMRVTGGSSVSSPNSAIGIRGNSGIATITGVGSQWNLGATSPTPGFLNVGHSGHGTLVIEQGGQVANSNSAVIGHETNGVGIATVTGTEMNGAKMNGATQCFSTVD